MEQVNALFPEAKPLDAQHGAYLLLIKLDDALTFTLRGKKTQLSAGLYAYAGSANGPGGIAARVARHMQREKKLHWHVDRLTIAAASIAPLAFPQGDECDLVRRLVESGHAEIPLKGFGSSDCRSCDAHLLRLSGDHRIGESNSSSCRERM